MTMNKDGVSDDGLVVRLSEHCKLKWMTHSKIDDRDYQIIPLDLLHEAIGELARAADRRAPAVVTEEMVENAVKVWADHPPTRFELGIGAVHDSAIVMRAVLEADLSVRAESATVKPLAELEARAIELRRRIQELRIDHPEAAERRRDELESVEAKITAIRSALVAGPAPDVRDPRAALKPARDGA